MPAMTREEYEAQNQCSNWTSIYSCYGNLDPLVYRDCNSIPFGVPVVTGSIHEVFLKNVEVTLAGIKNTFKQGRSRNFRTEKEKVYQFWADPIPEWLMEEFDAVLTRGEVYIGGSAGVGGTKYLVASTDFELVEPCERLWKPSATFHTHCGMPFGCEDSCTEESGESGGGESETPICCDPVVTNAESTPNGEGGNTITVTFTPCTPTPSGGWNIIYRESGSSGGYSSAGPFTSSPAVFGDALSLPEGTQYEGFIRSDCGDGSLGNQVPWSTGVTTVQIVNLSGSNVNITQVNGIPGFALGSPVGPGTQRLGSHGGPFTAAISATVTGSPISGSLSLYKNGSLLECTNIGSAGAYSFVSQSFLLADIIQVRWFGGAC